MSSSSQKTGTADSRTDRDNKGRFVAGNPHCWGPGRSGNPSGRPKGASFATALAKQAAAPVSDHEEMTKIAKSIGLDPAQAQNIDVRFYGGVSAPKIACRRRARSHFVRYAPREFTLLSDPSPDVESSATERSGPGAGERDSLAVKLILAHPGEQFSSTRYWIERA